MTVAQRFHIFAMVLYCIVFLAVVIRVLARNIDVLRKGDINKFCQREKGLIGAYPLLLFLFVALVGSGMALFGGK